MGTLHVARFADGVERSVAHFGYTDATLFFSIARVVERELEKNKTPRSCGITDADDCLTYWIDAETYVQFCKAFWEAMWLSRYSEMLTEWMRCAGGILENITLMPCLWTDTDMVPLELRRYALDEPDWNNCCKTGARHVTL